MLSTLFLLDFIGLVSAVSNEQQFSRSGNVTRKIELEITDHKYVIMLLLTLHQTNNDYYAIELNLFCPLYQGKGKNGFIWKLC